MSGVHDQLATLRAAITRVRDGVIIVGRGDDKEVDAALDDVEAVIEAARALSRSLGNPTDETYASGTFTAGGRYVSGERLAALAAALAALDKGGET